MIKNPTLEQESTKKYFKEKRENMCKKIHILLLLEIELALGFIMGVTILSLIASINNVKKKIKEIDSKTIKDISKDDKENFLKDCLKTKDEQAEERFIKNRRV